MIIYGDKDNFKTQKVLIAAKVAGKDVKVVGKVPPNKFPFGIAPSLEDGDVTIFSAEAITLHLVGNSPFYPQTPEHVQWLTWANGHLLPIVLSYVLPSASVAKVDAATFDSAKNEFYCTLQVLNTVLASKTFLVGERLTAADVSVALNLLPAVTYVLDDGARSTFVNVIRFFETVINQPVVKDIIGPVHFISKVAMFDEATHKTFATKVIAPEKKKEEKQQKKVVEERHDAADAPKSVDPFASLPASSFVVDQWKRIYSNEDTLKKAIPWLWENFDPENYSIWYAEYKYPEDLTQVFMSCNLIGGMFQRLEKLRKYGFGSVCLFGEDNNSTISGIWMWPGHELAFELCPDWQVDYESYTWKKLDVKDETMKKLVNEYLLWEGDFGGKKFNQGKIFK